MIISGHFNTGPNKTIHIIMAQLSHQLHLFHHVPTNVLLPLERQLLDPDNGALVLGCVTIGVDAPGFSGYEAAE